MSWRVFPLPASSGSPKSRVEDTTSLRVLDSHSSKLTQASQPAGLFQQLLPQELHKIFVWDPNGVYVDCYFPNPRYGHFLTHHRTLKGACVLDVFSLTVGRRLKTTIYEAWKSKEEQCMQLVFERDAQHFEANVICVPTQEGQVIGFVTDRILKSQKLGRDSIFPLEHDESSLVIPSQQTVAKECLSSLTPQEVKVMTAIRVHCTNGDMLEGQVTPHVTNEDIARQLHLSLRTVKFHLTNIYRKLHITSRYQLFLLL